MEILIFLALVPFALWGLYMLFGILGVIVFGLFFSGESKDKNRNISDDDWV